MSEQQWKRPCEIAWTRGKADRMEALMEKLSGHACPCWSGNPCPLLPQIRVSAPPSSILANK